MTDADYTDDLELLTNIPTQAKFLQHRSKQPKSFGFMWTQIK